MLDTIKLYSFGEDDPLLSVGESPESTKSFF